MIIFLTGERQIGKSTVIKKVLSQLDPGISTGGFFTVAGEKDVLIFDVSDPADPGTKVGERKIGGITEAFDTRGVEILKNAEGKDLIIMDELGWMEQNAALFLCELRKILGSGADVLGVIRANCSSPTCRAVMNTEDSEIIYITGENRDSAADIIFRKIKKH